jgi:solute carrier family 25 carnitine/acylcarnitine transporter 20/29
MEFWTEYVVKNNVGREFVAGGFGGTAGIITSYPFDTLRVMQQQSGSPSAIGILKNLLAKEGPTALFRGMAVPLASVGFQVSFFTFISSLLPIINYQYCLKSI